MKSIQKAVSVMPAAVFAMLCTSGAFGEEVSGDDAMLAARGWINLREAVGEEITAEPESVLSYTANGGKGMYYVVNLQGGGFVVTSGDTEVEPILAYSKDGVWNTNAVQNALMVMLNIDVAATMAELSSSNAAGTSGGRRLAAAGAQQQDGKAAKWTRLRSAASAKGRSRLQGASLQSINDVRVNTLMETKWGQSGHGENQYTPRGYVCGCVATAGAQIMRYWRYPTASITKIKNYYGTVDGTASWNLNDGYQTTAGGDYTPWNDDVKTFGGTYDWNNMPATVGSVSSTQKKAIGKLTLDVGRSVHMSYASDGSGSHYSLFATRLTDQFQYKNAALIIKEDKCSIDEIRRAILPSLDLKSPCGVSVPGHAIVADGYGYNNGTLYIHFNFGWTGGDNAWYNPPDLTAASSKYTSITSIIYNIYPPSVCSSSGRSILSGRVLISSGNKVANATVTARKGSTTYQATTDSNGIYAILVPAGTYTVQSSNAGATASTNVTVASTVSTRLANETGSSYYTSPTPVVGNVHGVELTFNQLPVPTFSPAAMKFMTDSLDVTLACATAGATIRYTTDGTEPTTSSLAYSAPITISGTTTIKAKAFKSNYIASDTVSATYTIAERAPTPTSTSTAGYRTTLVDLASTLPGAVIRYTTDGSDPTERSEVYAAGTAISVTNATGATTIKARVYAEGYRPSDVFSHNYYVKRFFGPTNGVNAAVWEDTPQNRADHWIFENEDYKEATGVWSNAAEYVDHKVTVEVGNEFAADCPSSGRNVTVETTATFNSIGEEHQDFAGAKSAVRIGTNAYFQVFTRDANDNKVWLDATNFAAEVKQDYTVRFELDFTNRMYSVAVMRGADYVPLTVDGQTRFPFAYDVEAQNVQTVGYTGEGAVTSIYGSYNNLVSAFAEHDVLILDGGTVTIDRAQAAWLNSMDAHGLISGKLGSIGATDFDYAWLLNLDLRQDNFGLDEFKVSGVDVMETVVRITVKLKRTGAMKSGSADAKINGSLMLYGGAKPGNAASAPANLLNVTPVTNADFGDGDTAVFEYPIGGGAKFFRPAIR